MSKPDMTRMLLTLILWFSLSGLTALGAENPDAGLFLDRGTDRIYFERHGTGFPLVLVSGGSGMDLRQWNHIAPVLAGDYEVILMDPRGVGRSDNPSTPYSDRADLEALLEHLDIDRTLLIGLSSAGGFVLEYASEYPARVAGVVALAPFIPGFEFDAAMMKRIETFSRAAQQGREPFLDAMLADAHFFPAPLDASARSFGRGVMAENYDKRSGFDPSLPEAFDPPLMERLRDIKAPVLLLAGELDHPEVFRRNQFLLGEISGSTDAMITRAGHNPQLENPSELLEKLEPYLSRHAR